MAKLISADPNKSAVIEQEALESALAASQRRCRNAGLNPDTGKLPDASSGELSLVRKNIMGGIAYTRARYLSYLKSLDTVLSPWGGAIVYTDRSLRICGLRGSDDALGRLAAAGIKFGTSLAESTAGTNAASLARDIMGGCRLDPEENWLRVFKKYVCAAQGPLRIGMDDFIIAMALVPAESMNEERLSVLDQMLYSLGIVSRQNERTSSVVVSSFLDAFTRHRGFGCIIVDNNRRISYIDDNIRRALSLQGSRSIGRYFKEIFPGLVGALDVCMSKKPKDHEAKVDGLTFGDDPAWALVTSIESGGEDYYALAIRSAKLQDAKHPSINDIARRADDFVGTSPAMVRLRASIAKLAAIDDDLLIVGESGTGKETAARAIHRASARGNGPFIICNCAMFQEGRQESASFGIDDNLPGLLERSRGGTLMLDNVECLPAHLQAAMESFLDSKIVLRPGDPEARFNNTRLIMASTLPVDKLRDNPAMRTDFVYRMPAPLLELPPLRDHPEDVALIAQNLFAAEMKRREWSNQEPLEDGDFAFLAQLAWTGNVRELKQAIARAFAQATLEDVADTRAVLDLTARALGVDRAVSDAPTPAADADAPRVSRKPVLSKENIHQALVACKGNKSAAAKLLGVSRQTLYAHLDGRGNLA